MKIKISGGIGMQQVYFSTNKKKSTKVSHEKKQR